jgi:hypothetical protein
MRLSWLRSCCVVAEGADVPLAHTAVGDASSRCPPEVCVGAVLGDALRRVAVLGGREGMSRSLGSVYGGSVTRFLGGLQGVVSRFIAMPGVESDYNGVAVSRDGSTLLVSDYNGTGGSCAIHVFSVADGSLLRVVGTQGSGPLQFNKPRQVWVASDGFVFVAESDNRRVQVLTPRLDFHAFVGARQLTNPAGVCANADVVVVSENVPAHRIAVLNRADGSLLRRFGAEGRGDGEFDCPLGLCFMSGCRVAVADYFNHRVSVFSVDGDFIHHVGVGVLQCPRGVACSVIDELAVADTDNSQVVVFRASGEVAKTLGVGHVTGVALLCDMVFAQNSVEEQCVVFT